MQRPLLVAAMSLCLVTSSACGDEPTYDLKIRLAETVDGGGHIDKSLSENTASLKNFACEVSIRLGQCVDSRPMQMVILKGDQNTYATEMKAAAEIWPTNPKLRGLSEMVGQNSDVQAQALMDLDRLLSQRNYRQIYNDQGRYLASAINDPPRQEQLKKVLIDMNPILVRQHQ